MMRILCFFFLAMGLAFGQVAVQKTATGSTGTLSNGGFHVPSGQTVTIDSGATINNNGTATGFGGGVTSLNTGTGSLTMVATATGTANTISTPSGGTITFNFGTSTYSVTSGTSTFANGAPLSGITGLGTGVSTALGIAPNTTGGFATYPTSGSSYVFSSPLTNNSGTVSPINNTTMFYTNAVPYILDTDAGDWDDYAAYCLASAVQIGHRGDGEGNLLAVSTTVNQTNIAPCVSGAFNYYGLGSIPVGSYSSSSTPNGNGKAASFTNFFTSIPGASGAYAENTVSMARRVLASQPNGSVKWVSIGGSSALYYLYNSAADSYSSLTGAQLLVAKCKEIDVMGGVEPAAGGGSGATPEYNMALYPTGNGVYGLLAQSIPVYFYGSNNTNTFNVNPANIGAVGSPLYIVGQNKGTVGTTWDNWLLLYALRGSSFGGTNYFTTTQGTNFISAVNGTNQFTPGSGAGNNEYAVTYAAGGTTNAQVAETQLFQQLLPNVGNNALVPNGSLTNMVTLGDQNLTSTGTAQVEMLQFTADYGTNAVGSVGNLKINFSGASSTPGSAQGIGVRNTNVDVNTVASGTVNIVTGTTVPLTINATTMTWGGTAATLGISGSSTSTPTKITIPDYLNSATRGNSSSLKLDINGFGAGLGAYNNGPEFRSGSAADIISFSTGTFVEATMTSTAITLTEPTTLTNGNFIIGTIGDTVTLKGGSNAASGTITLVAGTGTITSTAITANDVVLVGLKTAGGTETFPPNATVTTGTIIFNANPLDTGTYNWGAFHVNQ